MSKVVAVVGFFLIAIVGIFLEWHRLKFTLDEYRRRPPKRGDEAGAPTDESDVK